MYQQKSTKDKIRIVCFIIFGGITRKRRFYSQYLSLGGALIWIQTIGVLHAGQLRSNLSGDFVVPPRGPREFNSITIDISSFRARLPIIHWSTVISWRVTRHQANFDRQRSPELPAGKSAPATGKSGAAARGQRSRRWGLRIEVMTSCAFTFGFPLFIVY